MYENSYTAEIPKGAKRQLHANHLREFKVGVNGIRIVFEEDNETFGNIESCETGIYDNENIDTELNAEKLNNLDINELSVTQQFQLKKLLWKYKKCLNDKPGPFNSAFHTIKLREELRP